MSSPPPGRPLVPLFWRRYLGRGAISTAVGTVLLVAPGLLFPPTRIEHLYARIIGGVFLIFGLTRIVNAIIQLRRLGAAASRRPKITQG